MFRITSATFQNHERGLSDEADKQTGGMRPAPAGWISGWLSLYFLILLLGLSLPLPLQAQMVLSTIVIDFEPGKPPRKDIEIRNTGDEPLYVNVTPFRVLDPGGPEERREEMENPREFGLLVTPRKMVVPPGARKLVRFVITQPPGEMDRIYRVRIAPVAGPVVAEQTAIKVLVGYETLVIVRPLTLNPKLVAQRKGNTLTVSNEGNTNVLLGEGKNCDATGKTCKTLSGKRLYPGKNWSIRLSYPTSVDYYQTIGSENTIIRLP
jgi:P pilus assembly chaperone PapD